MASSFIWLRSWVMICNKANLSKAFNFSRFFCCAEEASWQRMGPGNTPLGEDTAPSQQ